MHETLKFDVTVRFALSEKLALKTPNVLIKNGFSRVFALFFKTVAVRYNTVRRAKKFG
jgi:hypothetical protein